MQIPIPYGLTEDQLVLEPGSEQAELGDQLVWLVDEVSNEDEAEPIMRAAVLLYRHLEGKATFGACLETAIIWDRG
jgi:hypothetical protein